MTAWRSAGRPSPRSRTVAPSRYAVELDAQLIATQERGRRTWLRGNRSACWTRVPHRTSVGETRHVAARTPGTLVGAKNVAHDVWFVGDRATLQSPDEVRRIAAREGLETDVPTMSFCNSGHWAATNWFVLSEVLGQKDVKPVSGVDGGLVRRPDCRWRTCRVDWCSSGCRSAKQPARCNVARPQGRIMAAMSTALSLHAAADAFRGTRPAPAHGAVGLRTVRLDCCDLAGRPATGRFCSQSASATARSLPACRSASPPAGASGSASVTRPASSRSFSRSASR